MPMQSGVVSAVGGPQGLPLLAESVRQPREPTSAVGFPCGGGVQVPVRGPGRKPAHSKSGNDGNGSPQTLPVFLFLEKVSGDRLLALPVRPPVLLRVLVGSVAAVGSHKPRRRSGPAPAQSDGAGVGGAETGPATFPDPGGRSREAQRTGFSPWKRSFCSSGQDRNGTVSCRGHRHLALMVRRGFTNETCRWASSGHRLQAARSDLWADPSLWSPTRYPNSHVGDDAVLLGLAGRSPCLFPFLPGV